MKLEKKSDLQEESVYQNNEKSCGVMYTVKQENYKSQWKQYHKTKKIISWCAAHSQEIGTLSWSGWHRIKHVECKSKTVSEEWNVT